LRKGGGKRSIGLRQVLSLSVVREAKNTQILWWGRRRTSYEKATSSGRSKVKTQQRLRGIKANTVRTQKSPAGP